MFYSMCDTSGIQQPKIVQISPYEQSLSNISVEVSDVYGEYTILSTFAKKEDYCRSFSLNKRTTFLDLVSLVLKNEKPWGESEAIAEQAMIEKIKVIERDNFFDYYD